jgi:hypothetical protein
MMKVRTFVTMATVTMMAAVASVGAQETGGQERVVALKAALDAQKLEAQKMLAEKIEVEGQQRLAVEARITPGVPYSGEAVTESLQLLADGNRIATKSVTRIYRDSEGRTRREMIGTDGQPSSISISDPVAHVTYALDPRTKEAYRNSLMMVTPDGVTTTTLMPATPGVVLGAKTAEGVVVKIEDKEAAETKARTVAGGRGRGNGGEPGAATVFAGEVGARGGGAVRMAYAPAMASNVGKTTTEDLGSQVVEGVAARGSRTTTVIEAGAIGNEQPIQIVSEQWIATDLKLLVMTKHSDPRTGETTYRLTNLSQAEPSRSLFELPSDYTLKESSIRRRQLQN